MKVVALCPELAPTIVARNQEGVGEKKTTIDLRYLRHVK